MQNPYSQARILQPSDLDIPALPRNAYKRTRGSIAVIGGSGRFTGAVVLATKAAFCSGAGLVTVFTEEKLIPMICKAVPSAMVTTYGDVSDLDGFDSVLIGPGMGKNHDDVLPKALAQAKRLVIDADGIRAFARLGLTGNGNCILTPHPGEFEALTRAFADTTQSFPASLEDVREKTGSVIVYKSDTVWIAADGKLSVYDGANPSLGVAGSGDVLAGITAALAARLKERNAYSIAQNAVLLHQIAGRLAHEDIGYYSSDTLVKYVGRALKAAENAAGRNS